MINNIEDMTMMIATMTEEQSSVSNEVVDKMHDIDTLTTNATERAATAYQTSDMLSTLSSKLDHQVAGMKVDKNQQTLLH